jgi:hypothetical protein
MYLPASMPRAREAVRWGCATQTETHLQAIELMDVTSFLPPNFSFDISGCTFISIATALIVSLQD